jgi:hypothetical protein
MFKALGDAINLADPGFEPTDEQLTGLSNRAIDSVTRRHESSLDTRLVPYRDESSLYSREDGPSLGTWLALSPPTGLVS